MTIIIFIVLLAVLVFAHELGHFMVAKWAGMRVDEFGFGFPPRLFGIKRGETTYSVNIIPLGGFVKIHGESGEHRQDPHSFASKSKWKRLFVLVAGVAMNLLLAWWLLAIGFMVGLPANLDGGVTDQARVTDAHVQMTYVMPESPADAAGFERGDRLLSVNGTSVLDSDRARELIASVPAGQELTLGIEREGATRDLIVTPEEIEEGLVAIGVHLDTVGFVRFPPMSAVVQGMNAMVQMTILTGEGFGVLIADLVSGKGVSEAVAGPVGIAVITGEVADQGFVYLLQFAAILSINLAILNILPIPALDGGRILFLIIEALRRRPVTARLEGAVHAAGFALLMILVVLVTYKDILNFVTR